MPKSNSSTRNDQEKVTLIERIPNINHFCLCFSLKCGCLFIGISGIVLGCVSFLAYLLLLGRQELDLRTVVLLMLMALFALANIMFIIGSVLLVMAACCECPDFIPAYIWISIIYWLIQLVLGIFIPVILILESGKSFFIGLVWSCLVMILCLTWTHYLAVVKSYMWYLYDNCCSD